MDVATMDSSTEYPDMESPMDQDDVIYPCKGCGEVLEEGKAFELAGNRWHIDCFRCHTCGLLLDSDANLLLLGDGSLICNNCTYSCSACGDKIEDLAILTGEQAFCASCFCCRNCKRKIENLRYARTSQGIFCMSCHESLMARRRKKSRQKSERAAAERNAHISKEKSLPALPQSAVPPNEFSRSTLGAPEPYNNDVSPRPGSNKSRQDLSAGERGRDASPGSFESSRKETLPASTYKDESRNLSMDGSVNGINSDDGVFVPLAFDPNPAPDPSPMAKSQPFSDGSASLNENSDLSESTSSVRAANTRDYFSRTNAPPSANHREMLKETLGHKANSSRSSSADRGKEGPGTPHIMFQEKGRVPSDQVRSRKQPSGPPSPAPPADKQFGNTTQSVASPSSGAPGEFKLQDAPKSRKASSRRSTGNHKQEGHLHTHSQSGRSPGTSSVSSPNSDLIARTLSPPLEHSITNTSHTSDPSEGSYSSYGDSPNLTQGSPPMASHRAELPQRGDSLAASSLKQTIPRKEIGAPRSDPTTPTGPTGPTRFAHDRAAPPASSLRTQESQVNGTQAGGKYALDIPHPPQRSASRPNASPQQGMEASDDGEGGSFTSPRPPPAPPTENRHKPGESISSVHSESASPSFLRYSGGGEFSLDEDMARIIRGEDMLPAEKDSSLARRISNAVSKHSRSFSDRGSRSSASQKWPRTTPINGTFDISNPTSPDATRDDPSVLRNQLRRAQQRIAELEAEKVGLQDVINSSAEIKHVNSELREKRSTVAVLDSQREIVLRELEVMTDQLRKAKDSNSPATPFDIAALKSDAVRELAASLRVLEDQLRSEIEELMEKRADLTQEIADLIQMKDKGFQEYEALSTRNAQLNTLNHQLVQSIQEMYKAGKHPNGSASVDAGRPGTNGLGIYHHQKDRSEASVDLRTIISGPTSTGTSISGPSISGPIPAEASYAHLLNGPDGLEHEPVIVGPPHVVKLDRTKGKANMWKKGGASLAKNIKGIRGALSGDRAHEIPRYGSIGGNGTITEPGMPYNSMPAGQQPNELGTPNLASNNNRAGERERERERQGFGGLFGSGQKVGNKLGPGHAHLKSHHTNSSSPSLSDGTKDTQLFGTDLATRCDQEKRSIPSIVIRCIEEVELRGMDAEGIYRKSGGSGQVNSVRAGFEKSNEFDISDPDLDIHAVTSALKQYFRRLPEPLITNTVYDALLEEATGGNIGAASPGEEVPEPEMEERGRRIREVFKGLPGCHRDCLEFLVFHLVRVVRMEKMNLMTPLNLAVVFAPTIMRPTSIEREMSDVQAQRVAVQTLLEQYKTIFDSEA
ncbi:RhoGAP-domain-containing protein [Eremomyces bilateralis CBS 781.70]|uniref:RhoGAP-domain-containing protein n=1 Tax=Eremomyces bilateralis CBS 781.70 TaxID=1392243 RepID=A0A6G1G157_9PEZI|nr:RhoGAP-domain-containing protein [Eremomyces bilateralis CBS 781.70]KAF1811660.1 RhoGAP-domain-containing protein [Eremomyces bilateralis CBS 781.70]